jgi:uncharacterized membrane protein
VIDRATHNPEHNGLPTELTSRWLVVAITLAGAALRILSMNTRSLWLDETTAVRQASWSIPEMLAWMANNVHPPLFHTLLHYWIRFIGRSEIDVRAFALVWGVAAIPLMYWAGRTLYDRKVGLISATILALSPFFIWYSQEIRMYTMMLVLALIGTVALYNALNGRGTGWWVAYALSASAGIMTQYFYAFLLVGQAFYVMRFSAEKYAALTSGEPPESRTGSGRVEDVLRRLPELRAWLIASAASVLPLLWWLPQVLSHPELLRGTSGAFNYGGSPPKLGIYFNELILIPVEAVFGFHAEPVMRNIVSMWPLIITMFFLSAGMAKRFRGSTSYLAACGIGGASIIVALGQWQPIILEVRYFTAVAAPLVILAARFLCELKPGVFRALSGVLIVVALVSWADQSYNPDSIVKWDNREAMSIVASGYQPGDTILLIPNFVSSVPEYYLPAQAYASLRRVPSFDAQGRPRNTPRQLAQDLERQVGPSHRVWLIATWQETPRIALDRGLTVNWLRSQSFLAVEDHPLRKIRVTLFETDPGREFFINPEPTP